METKFTPGTWEQSHREKRNGMYSTEVYDTETKETIATIAWYAMPPQRELVDGEYKMVTHTYREANANLISAAPDMFNALFDIYNDKEVWSDLFESQQEFICRVLNKATGSSFFQH